MTVQHLRSTSYPRSSGWIILAVGWLVVVAIAVSKPVPEWVINLLFGSFDPSKVVSSLLTPEFGTSLLMMSGCIRQAVTAVENEHDRIEEERDALRNFADGVAAMDVAVQPTVDPSRTVVTADTPGTRLRTVRDRYRETAMSIPHFGDDYGENLSENMATELGHDVASAVIDGDHLSHHLQRLLVRRARSATQQREALLEDIKREKQSLMDSSRRLKATQSTLEKMPESELDRASFSRLIDYDRELRRNTVRCEQLLTDRQREIHRTNGKYTLADRLLLQQYLYDRLESSFPVLNETLARIRRLENRREAIVRVVTDR